MKKITYSGLKNCDFFFPVGGIGTGCISLSGKNNIADFDIFDKPDKQSGNLSFFAVKAAKDGIFEAARILFSSEKNINIPVFSNSETSFLFPYCKTDFSDSTFPGKIKMTAFNPLIPFNDSDSSIPAAFFEFEIENTSDESFEYTLLCAMQNPFESGKNTFDGDIKTDAKGIRFYSTDDAEDDGSLDSNINSKNIYISTDFEDVSYQEYFLRADEDEKISCFLDELKCPVFKNRTYKDPADKDDGLIAAHFNLKSGEKKTVRFIISWYMRYVTENGGNLSDIKDRKGKRNYYCRFFSNSTECAAYCFTHWERLKNETDLFFEALYSSTLPEKVLDTVSTSLYALKSGTFMRDSDGNLVDYKNGNFGHILNFDYSICQLFPKLARALREAEYFSCMNDLGALSNHIPYPLGTKPEKFIPYADSQLGGILKVYREFKAYGDISWLKKIWPYVKHSLDYCFKSDSGWDSEKSGAFGGTKNTLYGEEKGLSIYTQTLYTASLKAASEMAKMLKEKDIANEYLLIAEKAKSFLDNDFAHTFDFLAPWYCENIGMTDLFDKEKLVSSILEISENTDSSELKFCLYPVINLAFRNHLTQKALELLDCGNIQGYDITSLSAYPLINAISGLVFDMHSESICINPILDFSKDGYFDCLFTAGEAFGIIEVGPRYIEMKVLSGQFKLRSFGLFKEPKVVYYGGRKFDFKADGCKALFDVSLICNKEKSIQIIFD